MGGIAHVRGGAHRALVRHPVLGEVELLGVVARLLERGLVDVVVVVDEPAVGHVPGVGTVPPGGELMGVPGILVSAFILYFGDFVPCSGFH